MVGRTARIRKSDRDRFEIIKMHCGCLPCMLLGHLDRHTSIEHVTDKGQRIGKDSSQHEATIGLCAWHHFSHCNPGRHKSEMASDYGPSLALGRHPFEEFFGSERHVLIPVQDFLLAVFERQPWPEYTISREAVRLTREKWTELNHAYQTR
jgi:hypothetical protein